MSLSVHDVQALHELQTKTFIEEAGTWIRFSRKVRASDGRGGSEITGENLLAPQRVRVVGQRRPPAIVLVDGREVAVDRSVVGLPDLDVKVGDTFEHGGHQYEIVNLQDEPRWRMTAEAIRRG